MGKRRREREKEGRKVRGKRCSNVKTGGKGGRKKSAEGSCSERETEKL